MDNNGNPTPEEVYDWVTEKMNNPKHGHLKEMYKVPRYVAISMAENALEDLEAAKKEAKRLCLAKGQTMYVVEILHKYKPEAVEIL